MRAFGCLLAVAALGHEFQDIGKVRKISRKGDLFLQVEPMCTYLICLTGLLLALVLGESVSALEIENPDVPSESLCPFVRSAAQETRLEDQARVRIQEAERFTALPIESRPPQRAEELPLRGGAAFGSERRLFESFLANWQFFEDLAPEQRAILQAFLGHCGVAADRPSLAASSSLRMRERSSTAPTILTKV